MYYASHAPASPSALRFAGEYRQVHAQTSVGSASAHHLITLLFDAFVGAVHQARGAIRERNFESRARSVTQAVRIVQEGLRAGLNLNAGGRLAADLNDLYAYVCTRLLQANVRNDESALDECLRLIQPLREAWAAIGSSAAARN